MSVQSQWFSRQVEQLFFEDVFKKLSTSSAMFSYSSPISCHLQSLMSGNPNQFIRILITSDVVPLMSIRSSTNYCFTSLCLICDMGSSEMPFLSISLSSYKINRDAWITSIIFLSIDVLLRRKCLLWRQWFFWALSISMRAYVLSLLPFVPWQSHLWWSLVSGCSSSHCDIRFASVASLQFFSNLFVQYFQRFL